VLTKEEEREILNIVREALSNCLRHAHAAHARQRDRSREATASPIWKLAPGRLGAPCRCGPNPGMGPISPLNFCWSRFWSLYEAADSHCHP
jgi:hypothetical protein